MNNFMAGSLLIIVILLQITDFITESQITELKERIEVLEAQHNINKEVTK